MNRTVVLTALAAIAAVPLTFAGVWFGWRALDGFLGRREVAAFIESRREVVAERLKNPRVHAFRLSCDPERPWQLVVKLDVADAETFYLFEQDLNGVNDLRFPPQWDIVVRSNEPVSREFGFPNFGELVFVLVVAALASILACAGVIGIGMRIVAGEPVGRTLGWPRPETRPVAD